MKGKLVQRYIGPFEIIERIRPFAYQLELPLYLDKIHNMFHVSLLWKAKINPSQMLPQVLIEIKWYLALETKSIKILDWGEKGVKE
jgi:hypothetical protein